MSQWLIEVSFGPVQGFIAAARRSRDLWAGSFVLSSIARAAAESLQGADKTQLIYPTDSAVNSTDGSNLSNVLLALVEADDEPAVRAVATAAQAAARKRLTDIARAERAKWDHALAPEKLRDDLWQQQVANAVDSYAAWSRIDPAHGYRKAYEALKRAFAARKNTRNFPRATPMEFNGDLGIPKSSLDGVNESVLPKARARAVRLMGLGEGEQLDALGCIKRSLGRAERFTALTRIAADAWLCNLDAGVLHALREAYEPLVNLGWATRTAGNAGIYGAFPYDAGLLFGGALEQALQEAQREPNAEAASALGALKALLARERTRPNPYVALMVADGDRMGVFVDKAQQRTEHSDISAAIATFADQVPAIAREHRGHAIFNGGEDLMVAFPLLSAVAGARALSAAFDAAVKQMVDALMPLPADRSGGIPTLRAGIAICHVSEPMGFIRGAAERAEKFAKGEQGSAKQGNALGLRLHVRAGHEVPARFSFDDEAAFSAFAAWMDAYRGKDRAFSGRVAYDIREVGLHLEILLSGNPPADTRAMAADIANNGFERVLTRAERSGGGARLDAALCNALRARRDALGAASTSTSIADTYIALGNELVLARWMSAVSSNELGERGGTR